jgi:2-succinyl-5-enolpyruvyl-6-hydroxy-3-cyclohexene-1-carboxylate synthase
MSLLHIYNIPEILYQLGIEDVIISPGSRSAPLVVAFNRHSKMNCKVVPDERSAAFVALGMSLQSGAPTVLICTSGSAAYNYAPAVAEAYYQQIPLLILTADRPPEWIDQWDGQTIQQRNIYGNHVLKSYQYPEVTDHKDTQWHAQRMINEAALLTQQNGKGPVHVNIPLREPLYPKADELIEASKNLKIFEVTESNRKSDLSWIKNEISNFKNIVIVAGQQASNRNIAGCLELLSDKITVICEAQSNFSFINGAISHHDLYLNNESLNLNPPDLLITFGKSIISKNLKQFLRTQPPQSHWHISEQFPVPDTFQSLTKVIKSGEIEFIKYLADNISVSDNQIEYLKSWQQIDQKVDTILNTIFDDQTFSEFEVIKLILDHLGENVDVHVANSMSIRYVNFLGIKDASHRIFVNRGTSGIDGSVSTAVGSALKSGKRTILVTGDLAFFYDRNGLWHNHMPKNLDIFILNNHGGGIFGMINGPKQLPEAKEFFITEQKLKAENTAKDFNLPYSIINDKEELLAILERYKNKERLGIVEITTNQRDNEYVLKYVKSSINSQL